MDCKKLLISFLLKDWSSGEISEVFIVRNQSFSLDYALAIAFVFFGAGVHVLPERYGWITRE